MSPTRRIPDAFWRLLRRMNSRLASRYGPNFRAASMVLVLTTTGRKSGLPRQTPLQYEEVNGEYYIASARGASADWFRNLQANPQVSVQIKERRFEALAEPVTDPARIADFLELRLQRHPRMKWLLLLEGLPARFSRLELEAFAAEKALAILRPC